VKALEAWLNDEADELAYIIATQLVIIGALLGLLLG